MSVATLLRHDRLHAIGGSQHGKLLPIVSGADTLMIAEPVQIDWSAGVDDVDPLDHVPQRTNYRRLHIAIDGTRLTFDVLVADGYQVLTSMPISLTHCIGAACVSALSGGREVVSMYGDVPNLADCLVIAERDRSRQWWHMPADDAPTYSPDTWSQAGAADRCWRCDAAWSTTDVGLCEPCLVDLREDAA